MMKDIEIKISRETRMVDLSKTTIGNDGENLQGNLVFSFTDEFVKGQGRLEYIINGESKYAFLLNGNDNYYIPIKSVMTKEGQIDMQLVITEGTDVNEIPIFKSNVFYVSCKKSINAEVKEEEEYYSWIEIANTKLNEVDEAIEELASQSNYAKDQGDYAKEQGTNAKNVADDTQKKAEEGKFNGKSLEFVWEGTKLGVRLEGQEEYHFVDLQGKQGEIGATGEPFKIKKTYGSVSEMNADFRNMKFGDYVMIASSVDVEDNAKLYTRGESAWIFISDFSGAMGIRGETGLTPNIKIGEVKTLEAGSQASVTRSGSNEEPVLNFALPKGDKGDNYVLTEEDKVEIGEKVNTEYGERITENEKDIVDIETYLDTITPKSSAKGELVHVTDALPLATFENKVDGNVEQETTKGTNKLDTSKLTTTKISGVDVTVNKDGSITFNGTMEKYIWLELSNRDFNLPSGDYTWSLRPSYVLPSGDYTIGIRDKNNVVITAAEFYQDIENVTLNEDLSNGFVAIYIGTLTTFNNFTIYPMLVEGTYTKDTIPPFEKFTNGASPNPEYPQDIEVLEAYNEFNHNVAKNDCIVDSKTGEITITKDTTDIYIQGAFVYNENNKFMTLEAGNYYIKSTNSNVRVTIYSDGSALDTAGTQPNVLSSITNFGGIRIRSVNDESLLNQKFGLMINKGSYLKPYLPYGCVGYKVNGKNIFDRNRNGYTVKPTYENDKILWQGTGSYSFVDYKVNCKPNTKYAISFSDKNCTMILSKKSNATDTINWDVANNYVFTTTGNMNEFYIRFTASGSLTYYVDKFQIELDKATPYEPYQEQIVPLDLKGNFVGAINDNIKDYLVTDKKKYWLVKNVGKYVFTGDENFNNFYGKNLFSGQTFFNDKLFLVGYGLSNYYIYNPIQSGVDNNTKHGEFVLQFSNENNAYNIFFKNTNYDNTENFKADLKQKYDNGNPVIVYYPTKESEIIELGELPEPIKTFEGVNNIQLLANLDTEIEVKYALDVKKYYDNKLAEISAQII